MTSTKKISETKLEETISHLSAFVLPENLQHLPQEISKFFIEQAFALNDNRENTVIEIREYVKKLFDLDFTEEEISKSVTESGIFLLASAGKYRLQTDKYIALNELNSKNKTLESSVFYRWGKHLKNKYSTLGEEEFNQIINDLRIFFAKLLFRHGAACANIFYSDSNTMQNLFCDDLFLSLPRRKKDIENIRKTEIINFFLESANDTERQKMIFDQLNASFIYRIVSIEPTCSNYIKSTHFVDDEIYLDCNFIFNLFGLSGEEKKDVAREVLKIATQFKFLSYVTGKTSEEYNVTLGKYRLFLKNSKLPSKKVLLAANGYVRENPISAYWREYAKTGISVDEFFEIYKGLDGQLRAYNALIVKRGAESITDSALRKEMDRMKSHIPLKTRESVLEHDSFCLLYVRKRKNDLKVKNKKAYFLTEDHPLLEYEKKVNRHKSEDSVCILSYQLLQLLRPLIPRTTNFEKAFIVAVMQPILRSQELLPTDIATIVLNRFSLYKNQPLKLIPRLLTNSYITNKLKYLKKQDSEKADELIDNCVLAEAEEIITEAEKLVTEKTKRDAQFMKELEELREFKKEIEARRKEINPFLKFIFGLVLCAYLNYLFFNNIDVVIKWVDAYAERNIFWVVYALINGVALVTILYFSFRKYYKEIRSWFAK